ncbi:MAG: hypothetical protein M1839_005540 [Geoglossum umbratile]|nr:MAG: hypothetical protein M1839_005540 [Geoglossum umbratile]
MLAVRDQENLVHSRQTAAASKPLNQGTKHVAPKTPGARAPKTPFKVPLNDENMAGRGGGKSVMRTVNRVNENLMAGGMAGDKTAFITPLGPRNRAPLGLKTTNAKAKAFQTPLNHGGDDGVEKTRATEKQQQQSATTRGTKPASSYTENNKLEVHDEKWDKNNEREIEYMPPRPKELPDYPEDFPADMDYSQLQGQNLTRGWFQRYCNPIDDEGVSLAERQWDKQQKKADRKVDELMERVIEEMPLIGYNIPEFPGDETFVSARMKREAEGGRGKKIVATVSKLTAAKMPAATAKGPTTVVAKKAASALSMKPASAKTATIRPKPAPKAKIPASFLVRSKTTTTPKPTNPSPMRHTAATATSKTTLGYTNGRSASATLSQKAQTNNSNKAARTTRSPSMGSSSATLTPAMFTAASAQPEFGTEEWRRMKTFSDFESDDEVVQSLRGGGWDTVDEEAEKEFVLGW